MRHADHVHPALLDAYVLGRALEHLGGDPCGSLADLARGLRDRGSGVGGHATSTGAHAKRKERGVAGIDLHILPGRAQLGGGDLRQRRRVTLALRRHADVHVDLAARIDPDRRAFVRAEPGTLRVAGQADADAARAARRAPSGGGALAVVQERQRALEGRREIAGIVGDRDAVLVGQSGRYGMSAGRTKLRRRMSPVEPEPPRADVHQALHHEHRLGPPGRAIPRVEGLGGDHARAGVAIVRTRYGPGRWLTVFAVSPSP